MIQFSPAFAQLLQQSLARQSRSTAERIGIPGLVLLDEAVETGGGGDDDGTGAFLWGAGAALASMLYRDMREQLRGSRVLELGCGGTAVVSIAAAAAGATKVVATDLPSRLSAAARNVGANSELAAAVRVAALDWAEGKEGVVRLVDKEEEDEEGTFAFDWVLGADLTYEKAAMRPLARTVAAALRLGAGGGGGGGGGTTCLLAHRPRSREVDAAMAEAFEAEGLAMVVEEEQGGAARLTLTGPADAPDGGSEGGSGGDDEEPLILYRVVVVASGAT